MGWAEDLTILIWGMTHGSAGGPGLLPEGYSWDSFVHPRADCPPLDSDEGLIPATVLPAVGRLLIEFTSPMPLERVQRENPGVLLGGRYTPPDCTPAQTVAVIIPFRHREHHLRYWLHYLHPILRRQRLRYGVYVINQVCCPWPQAGH